MLFPGVPLASRLCGHDEKCDAGRCTTGPPMRVAEQRSKRGGSPRGLSEWRAQLQPFAQVHFRATSSAAARVCEQRREPRRAKGSRGFRNCPCGQLCSASGNSMQRIPTWGRLSLPTFFGEAKKVGCRRATPGNRPQPIVDPISTATSEQNAARTPADTGLCKNKLISPSPQAPLQTTAASISPPTPAVPSPISLLP